MMDSKLKGLAFCSVVALFATGQAMAHTGVRDKAIAGVASYNGFTITHGCDDYANPVQSYPVLGQAALFPGGGTEVWREANNTIIDGSTIVSGVYNLGVNGYAGFGSAFTTSREIVDDLGTVHALLWKDGAMDPKLNTITSFKITHPAITDACIASVKVRVGVINYCDVGKNMANDARGPYKQPKDAFNHTIPMTVVGSGIQTNVTAATPVFKALPRGNGPNNRADWWFKDLEGGSNLYNDPAILGESGLWSAGITVANPTVATGDAAAACPGGAPRQVTVEPAGIDFDTYLTGANTQPFTSGNGPF